MSDNELPDGYSFVPSGSGWFAYTSDTDRIEKKYQLTSDEYHRMLSEQDNKCAICGRDAVSVGALHVDHDDDHPEKRVRGLLCGRCNRGLGLFDHEPPYLDAASRYLIERGCAYTRRIDQYAREERHPETIEAIHRLELRYLDGDVRIGAVAVKALTIGADQHFILDGIEWRISERHPLPPLSGISAEHLVCHEVE